MLSIITYGFIEGLLIALVALAFQLSYSGLKLFDIGIGGVYIAASYFFIGISKLLSVSLFSTFLSGIGTIAGIIVLTLGIERFVYRPFLKKGVSSLILLLVSLSVYTIIINFVAMTAGVETQIINLGLAGAGNEVFGVIFTQTQILQIIIAALSLLAIYFLLSKTILGKKIIAISENLTLFQILGFDENRTRQSILILGAVLVSIASILKTADVGIDPFSSGFHIVLLAAIAVIIGGITSYKGAIIGSIMLGLTMNLAAWYFNGDWKEAATFGLLIIVLLIKRDGLFHTELRAEG